MITETTILRFKVIIAFVFHIAFFFSFLVSFDMAHFPLYIYLSA